MHIVSQAERFQPAIDCLGAILAEHLSGLTESTAGLTQKIEERSWFWFSFYCIHRKILIRYVYGKYGFFEMEETRSGALGPREKDDVSGRDVKRIIHRAENLVWEEDLSVCGWEVTRTLFLSVEKGSG